MATGIDLCTFKVVESCDLERSRFVICAASSCHVQVSVDFHRKVSSHVAGSALAV